MQVFQGLAARRAAGVMGLGIVIGWMAPLCAAETTPADSTDPIAVITTSLGVIRCELFPKTAPKTVENFIGLATGTKEFTDPATHQKTKRAFYDNTIFHRVIPKFMIQGGDPLASGMGGPGYTIDDEFGDAKTGLKFDVPGRLAMANTGRPKSAGSQFFITTDPAAYLNGSYTIFGQVLSGQSVVHDISIAARNQQDKPYRDIKIESITIEIAK